MAALLASRSRRTSRPARLRASDGSAVQNACRWVAADFAKPVPQTRLLFPGVTLADTPANQAGTDKILATSWTCLTSLWNQRVTSTDAEVQRMYKLLTDVYADRANASRKAADLPVERGQ